MTLKIRETAEHALARAKAATLGPWVQWEGNAAVYAGPLERNTPSNIVGGRGQLANCDGDDLDVSDDPDLGEIEDDDEIEDLREEKAMANAAFIAGARSDVPLLATFALAVTSPEMRDRIAARLTALCERAFSAEAKTIAQREADIIMAMLVE